MAGLLPLPEVSQQTRHECETVGIEQADSMAAVTNCEAGLIDAAAHQLLAAHRVLSLPTDRKLSSQGASQVKYIVLT